MKHILALAAVCLLLTGCSRSYSYIVTWEVAMKNGQTVKGSEFVDNWSNPPTKANVATLVNRLQGNSTVNANGIVILTIQHVQ